MWELLPLLRGTWPHTTTGLAGATDEAYVGGALGGTRTPNREVTDQNKRAMAFRSLKSQAFVGRGSHGRNQGQGFRQGFSSSMTPSEVTATWLSGTPHVR